MVKVVTGQVGAVVKVVTGQVGGSGKSGNWTGGGQW